MTLATLDPKPRLSVDRSAPFLWYTLGAIPHSQARVCQRAGELRIETYVPMSRTPPEVRRGRLTEPKMRPLMPGYIFTALPTLARRFDLFQPDRGSDRPEPLPEGIYAGYVADRAQPRVEPIRGCLGFVGNSEGPMAVSEAVIEDMRLREKNGEFDLTGLSEDGRFTVPKWVKVGKVVEFIDGPFRGFLGTIVRALSNALVEVGVTIFGRASKVTVPWDWIRRVR